MRVHPHITIGEIAAALPHTTKLFDVLGLDYVLHGNLSLRDACAEAGVDPSQVRQSIEAMPYDENELGWSDRPMQELLDELRNRRHPKVRAMLAATAALLAQSAGTPPIIALREAFTVLCAVLQPHMTREEHVLFPVVQHLEDCWTHSEHAAVAFVGGIGKPMAALVDEHATIIGKLHDVRSAATDAPPKLLDAIEELEHELREHIHLENNVLYPRAAAIEAAVGT
jgi:regulator of cell morphogenesis and NO signaling